MSQFLVTTSGTLDPVVLQDLGGRTIPHPTTDLDLLLEFSRDELSESADLTDALDNGHLTATSDGSTPISDPDDVFVKPGDNISVLTNDSSFLTETTHDALPADNPHSVTAAQVGADPSGTAASAISTHEAAADPHSQYLTQAEGDAAYATIGQGGNADTALQPGDDISELNNDSGYLTETSHDALPSDNPHGVTAAQVGADPSGTASSAIATHEAAADPHSQYLTAAEGNAAYATAAQGTLADSALQSGDNISELTNDSAFLTESSHDALPADNPHSVTAAQVGADPTGTAASAVTSHEAALDPHPQYLTPAEGNAAYATAAQGTLADSALQSGDDISELNNDEGFETPSELDARDTANRNRTNHTGTQSIETLTELPAPTAATAGVIYFPRVNSAGDGYEFFRHFQQIDERTTGLINQQNGVYEPFLTANYTIPATDDYLIEFSYIYSLNNTTRNFECHLDIDGTDIYPLHIEPKDSAGAGQVLSIISGGVEGPGTVNSGTDQFLNNAGSLEVNLTSGDHTIIIEFSGRGDTNLEAAMYRALLKVTRIP